MTLRAFRHVPVNLREWTRWIQSQDVASSADLATKEDGLGNPPSDGFVLSSDTDGNRSWVSPASGSSLQFKDEGTNVTNTPHSIVNFSGAGVTASDGGGGQVNVVIPGGGGGGGDLWSDPVDSDIIPDGNNTRELGSSSLRFQNLFSGAANVSGNITVGGTVDGRNIATDGSTLDAVPSTYTAKASAETITGVWTYSNGPRLANNVRLFSRNFANNANVDVAYMNTSDKMIYGQASGTSGMQFNSPTVPGWWTGSTLFDLVHKSTTAIGTPDNLDRIPIFDQSDSWTTKYFTWADLPSGGGGGLPVSTIEGAMLIADNAGDWEESQIIRSEESGSDQGLWVKYPNTNNRGGLIHGEGSTGTEHWIVGQEDDSTFKIETLNNGDDIEIEVASSSDEIRMIVGSVEVGTWVSNTSGGLEIRNSRTSSMTLPQRALGEADLDSGQFGFYLQYDSSGTMANPGITDFRVDDSTPANVTQVALSHTSYSRFDQGDRHTLVQAGDIVYAQDPRFPLDWALWEIDGVTDNTDWTLWDVTVLDSGTQWNTGNEIVFTVWPFSRASGGGGADPTSPETISAIWTFSSPPRLTNNTFFQGRNALNNASYNLIGLNSLDRVVVGQASGPGKLRLNSPTIPEWWNGTTARNLWHARDSMPGTFRYSLSHNITNSATTIPYNTVVYDPDSNYTNSSGEITIDEAGYYDISVSIPIDVDSTFGGTWARIDTWLERDPGGGAWGTLTHTYSSTLGNENSSDGFGIANSFIVSFDAGDKFRIRILSTNANALDCSTITDRASCSIHRIREN